MCRTELGALSFQTLLSGEEAAAAPRRLGATVGRELAMAVSTPGTASSCSTRNVYWKEEPEPSAASHNERDDIDERKAEYLREEVDTNGGAIMAWCVPVDRHQKAGKKTTRSSWTTDPQEVHGGVERLPRCHGRGSIWGETCQWTP